MFIMKQQNYLSSYKNVYPEAITCSIFSYYFFKSESSRNIKIIDQYML